MMNFMTGSLLGIVFFLVLISIPSQSFGQNVDDKIFPDWVKQATEI